MIRPLNWLKALITYGAGEASSGPAEVTDGDGFFEKPDEQPAGDTEDKTPETKEEEQPEDKGEETTNEQDDKSGSEGDGGESEESPDSEGDGAEDDGGASAAAAAVREAVRATLTVAKSQAGSAKKGPSIKVPTADDLSKLDGFKDFDKDDLKGIAAIAGEVIRQTLETYHKEDVSPAIEAQRVQERKQKIVTNFQDFIEKYPKAFEEAGRKDAMSKAYDELATEFGQEAADKVTFEQLYIMTGGQGRKAATETKKGVADRLAKEQKKAAVGASSSPERVGKVRTGGSRKPTQDETLRQSTSKHIRDTVITPFTIR